MIYTLRKSTAILKEISKLYRKKCDTLTDTLKYQFKSSFQDLAHAIDAKDRTSAHDHAKVLQQLAKLHLKKNLLDHAQELGVNLLFALVVAVIVRQSWGELYEIPSGSMRPTLLEKDRIVVSKNQFGVNIPLQNKHLTFDDDQVERGGIFVFSGKDMPIRDNKHLYFYLFPGIKQYIKRMIGKPGDTLYFYGGKIYGLDKNGNDISAQFHNKNFEKIDHVPFINFEGKSLTNQTPTNGVFSPVFIYQMNEPVAKLEHKASLRDPRDSGKVQGKMLTHTDQKELEYHQLWGMGNYAFARLITPNQLELHHGAKSVEKAPLYLEILHHPSIKTATLETDLYGRHRPTLGKSISILPLFENHLKTLYQNLYTSRFTVKNGEAYRVGTHEKKQKFLPPLPGIPNGTYEFLNGIAYKINLGGVATKLSKEHPLNQYNLERLLVLYNMGIEVDSRYEPYGMFRELLPSRHAYWRNGDLYVMGQPLMQQGSEELNAFIQAEKAQASGLHTPFLDQGAPLNADGTLNTELVKNYGLTVPANSFLGLGDNHAVSLDCRDFGFIPRQNLRGVPKFIFWTPGERFGLPKQATYTHMNKNRAIVWAIGLLSILGWSLVNRRLNQSFIRKMKGGKLDLHPSKN
ncbi:MAG: hypothetical protein S4CHLAM102_02260 [Chlamydiia bacterium]|nr:hypothetical protein [Chlamydiia bacterium]